MGPKSLKEMLRTMCHTKIPVMILGQPGIGKSSCVQQLTQEMGVNYLDVRCLLHDPSDLKFPVVDAAAKTIHWVNSIFPKDPNWKGIVALEEVDKCGQMMQGALLQPVLDRRIGEYQIPDGVWFILVGNRAGDHAGGHEIITPMRSRCITVELAYSVDDWDEWAVNAGIDFRVRMFVTRVAPHLLCKFDPSQTSSPNPRSWSFVSEIRKAYASTRVEQKANEAELKSLAMFEPVSGAVGAGAAATFLAYCRVADNIPDVEALLRDPGKGKIPDSPEVLWSLCGAICERVKINPKLAASAYQYADRLPNEYGVMLGRDILRVCGDATQLKECQKWVSKHRNVLIESNAR